MSSRDIISGDRKIDACSPALEADEEGDEYAVADTDDEDGACRWGGVMG